MWHPGRTKCYTLGERNVIYSKINNRWSPKNNRGSPRIGLPGQKKVEVARGVIELGQILKETRDGANNYHDFEQWLDDRRVNFKRHQANKYIKIYEELGLTESRIFDDLSLNKLYTLASAPEEVKEDVANSKDLGHGMTNFK